MNLKQLQYFLAVAEEGQMTGRQRFETWRSHH